VRDTRAYAAMRTMGRDDLRTALWLSSRGFPGSPDNLEFAEIRPDIAENLLPGRNRASAWHCRRFRRQWNGSAALERLIRWSATGSATTRTAPHERHFRLPAWLLNGLRSGGNFLWRPLEGVVHFAVDATGVRCLAPSGQNGGGLFAYELPLAHCSSDRFGDHRVFGCEWDDFAGTGEERNLSRRAVAQSCDNWNEFVDAASRSRVFAAMRGLGRDSLAIALWLSVPEPGGMLKRLQLAENSRELANQMLPLPGERGLWRDRSLQGAWRRVSDNAKAKEIARHTWFGDDYARQSAQSSSIEERLLAQNIASGRLSLDRIRSDHSYRDYHIERCHRELVEAWSEIDGRRLRELTWKRPQALISAVSAGTRLHAAQRKPWFLPVSLIVGAIRTSGLDLAGRINDTPELARDWADAVRDFYERSLKPQLAMAGYDTLPTQFGEEIEAELVKKWLQLLYGSTRERAEVARDLPNAAREAAQRAGLAEERAKVAGGKTAPRPSLRDIREWNRRWHSRTRLERARTIATEGDSPVIDRDRFALPLVLEAGEILGPNMRLIETVEELNALGKEEEHCIPDYASSFRTGQSHCLVIEDAEDSKRRSTAVIEESTRLTWNRTTLVLAGEAPYRLREIRMSRNAKSPPEHRKRVEMLVDAWNRRAAGRQVEASPEEARRRDSASRTIRESSIRLDRVQPYWDRVSKGCVPAWLHDFDPAEGLLLRLYREYREAPG